MSSVDLPRLRRPLGLALSLLLAAALSCARAQTAPAPAIRLAVIEGMSGPFANAGASVLRNLQFAVERINQRGGVAVGPVRRRLELVSYDGKGQTDESLTMLRDVVNRRIRFVLQGNSSAVAAAIVDAINKHNEREPSNRVLFLNYSAVDPALTNEACSFWHFRFDAHAGMRMDALIGELAANPRARRVYLFNEDYSFGREFARLARAAIARQRPDVEIVGDELVLPGQVKDFMPYALKVKAADADTVVTGNWGNDLSLMVRALRDIGADTTLYTFYGNSLGAPAAIGEAGVGRVYSVAEWNPNADAATTPAPASMTIYRAFRRQLTNPAQDYFNMRHVAMLELLAGAIEAAGTTEAAAVARALEGRRLDAEPTNPYPVLMRADDHQLLGPLTVSVMTRKDGSLPYDVEASGYGFRVTRRFDTTTAQPAHGCRMKRP